MLSRLRSVVRALVGRRRFEDGLADEVRQHIELYTDDLVRQGMPREEASRRARLEFGSIDNVTLDCREAKGLGALRRAAAASALRSPPAAKEPGLHGDNAGDARPVSRRQSGDLRRRGRHPAPTTALPDGGPSGQHLQHVPEGRRARRRQLGDELLRAPRPASQRLRASPLYRDDAAIVGETGATEREYVMRVTPEFFTTLGVGPALGRAFTEGETTFQTSDVAIVSDTYWREHLGRRPAGDRTCAARGRRALHGGRRAAAGVQLPLLEAEPVPAARNGPAGARPRATSLRQLVAHDRAASARRLARGGAVADRRPQRARWS